MTHWRLAGAVIAIAAVAMSTSCGAQAGEEIRPAWTTPVPLAGVPSGHHLQWTHIAEYGDTAIVAGNLFSGTGAATAGQTLVLTREPGGPIPSPAGPFQFVYPKVAVAPNGDIHLLWSEFAQPRPNSREWFVAQASVWHAVHRRGQWSTPENILSGSVQWSRDDGHIEMDASGVLHVVAWLGGTGSKGLIYLRRNSSGWHKEPIPFLSMRPDAAIATFGDTVVVVFHDTEPSAAPGGLAVLISPTRGSWTRSPVLRPLGARYLSHPQFLQSQSRTSLVWAEIPANGVGIDTLRISAFRDARPGRDLGIALPKNAAVFRVTQDACGGVIAAVDTYQTPLQVLELSVRSEGQAFLRPLMPTFVNSTFGAVARVSGDLFAVVTGQVGGGRVETMVARRPSC